ncbi:hypothetical protein [Tunturiibacter gelidiferens]|uniref:Uncharacterized protein n=1 Tax=Tunturiibacter gelidiferens TaxID=3069689 RepID=A0AAU7Z1D6_9BACT
MATGPVLTPPTDKQRSIRGPLRYQISTSSPQLEAGTKFSIYTRITNPYDVPVKITSVTTLLPVEFIDVAVLERSYRNRRIARTINTVKGHQKKLFKFVDLLPGSSKENTSPRMSNQALSSTPETEADVISDSDVYSIVQLLDSTDKDNYDVAKQDVLQRLHRALAENKQVSPLETELQPGNSIIQVFTLKTNRSIFSRLISTSPAYGSNMRLIRARTST